MTIVRWCKLCVVLVPVMQACTVLPIDASHKDVLPVQDTNFMDGLARFPAVSGPGVIVDHPALADQVNPPNPPHTTVWQHRKFPGKQPTQYSYVWEDGRHAVRASATSSVSMLRYAVHVEPALLQDIVFSWKVNQLIPKADLASRDAHDSPVRLVLAFEGDRSEFSVQNALLSELSLTLTGETMPYATLMYVWCNSCEKETLYVNPRTDRIREIVLETGPEHVGQWLAYRRDIQADYLKAFGQAPGALVGVGLMTDTDNTRQSAVAWYGPISLTTHAIK